MRAGRVVVGTSVAAGAAAGMVWAARRSRHAGTRGDEATRSLPGDDLAPGARSVTTRAIAIAAPPGSVLPWLKQMGHRRGGWYAIDPLERAIGAGGFREGRSATRVHPDLQRLAVGDRIALDDRFDLEVAVLDEPPTTPAAVVLTLVDAPLTWVWSFTVWPDGAGSRLVVRTRVDAAAAPWRAALPLLDVGHAVMEGVQLWRLRRRVEGAVGHDVVDHRLDDARGEQRQAVAGGRDHPAGHPGTAHPGA